MSHPLDAIADQLPHRPSAKPTPVGGGCIHQAWRWSPYFIKLNDRSRAAQLQAEAEGLRAIADTRTIRVPEIVATGIAGGQAYLVLEALDLQSSGNDDALGEHLARLHANTADTFGFDADNFIGSTPQPNSWCAGWAEFFRDQRLKPLLDRLDRRGIRLSGARDMLDRLPGLLAGIDPQPSLLHGDLWAGNHAFLPDGTPVIFDPACYHGHAACDLAMSRLFGGFSQRFYDAYRAHAADVSDHDPSLDPVYNLYHILNHALLFGGGYIAQARDLVRHLLR